MFNIFNKPHPFIFNAYSVAIPSVVTLLILLLFSPFSLSEIEPGLRITVSIVISVLVAISIFFTVRILRSLFPKMMSEDRWTVGKEFLLILFVLFIIVILTLFISLFLASEKTNVLFLFFKTAGLTIAISIFPIIVSILFEQFRHQKAQFLKVSQLTESLEKKNEQLEKEKLEKYGNFELQLKSEKNDVELQLEAADLSFVKSDGNYVEVFYKRTQKIEKKLIRNKLKSIESELPDQLFLRCHNRYIINLGQIVKVEGNARNLSLFLKDVDESIPVSRAKSKTIESYLNKSKIN